MQEKYFGDFTDFYKFFFLKNIIGKYKLGINWCLTPNDETNDGNKKIENKLKLEKIDTVLYNILLKRKFSDIIKYFNENNIKDYREEYKIFHLEYKYETDAFNKLKKQDIIFFDPDTGIEMPSKKLSERYKYISYRTITKYWNEKKTLIIFQHKDRKKNALNEKKENLINCLDCSKNDILIVNTRKVYYICIINKKHISIKTSIKDFCKKYSNIGYKIEIL